MLRTATALMVVVLLTASVVPATAVAETQDSEAYAGTHVSFAVDESALTDYAVGGVTIADRVAVESQSEHRSQAGLGLDVGVSAVTNLAGAGLSLDLQAQTSATIAVESGAEISAHDNRHGHLIVEAGGESQFVEVDLAAGAEADQQSDGHLVVTADGDRQAAFLVVGDGEVTVNDEGNVVTALESDAELVVRSYEGERTEDDEETERMIAEGVATAEAHVMAQDGEFVVDAIEYGQDTTVESATHAENAVTVTVDRAASEGAVIVTSVSDAAIENVENLEVAVDGEAAVEAQSYSELEGAFGSDASRYMVASETATEADATVLVAVNQFSERTVTMSEGDGAGGDGIGSDSIPGFGVGLTLVALIGAALLARRGSN